MTKVYHVTMMYLDADEELIPEHRIINYQEYHKAENDEDIKQQLIDLVDANIDENQDWIRDVIIPKGLTVTDKTYCEINDCNDVPFWFAERIAEDKNQNCIMLVSAEAYEIKPEEAINHIPTVN